MTKHRVVRLASVVLVAGVAEVACLTVAGALSARADAAEAARPEQWAGLGDALAAGLLGLWLMPLVLWAGMRLLRQRGDGVLIGVSSLVWFLLGLPGIAQNSNAPGRAALIACFAVLCGLMSLLGTGGNSPASPAGPHPAA